MGSWLGKNDIDKLRKNGAETGLMKNIFNRFTSEEKNEMINQAVKKTGEQGYDKAQEVLSLISYANNVDKKEVIEKILTLNHDDLSNISKDKLEDISGYVHGYLTVIVENVSALITRAEKVEFKGISNATVEKRRGIEWGDIFNSFSKYQARTDFSDAKSVREAFKDVYENFRNVAEVEKIHSEMIKLMMFLNRLNPSIIAVLAEGIKNDLLKKDKEIELVRKEINNLGSNNNETKKYLVSHEKELIEQSKTLKGLHSNISAIGDMEKKINKEAELNKKQEAKLDEHAEIINRARIVIKEKVGSIESTLDKEADLNRRQEEAIAKEAELNRQQQAFIDEVDKLIKDRKSIIGRLKIYLPAYLGLACGATALALHFIKL